MTGLLRRCANSARTHVPVAASYGAAIAVPARAVAAATAFGRAFIPQHSSALSPQQRRPFDTAVRALSTAATVTARPYHPRTPQPALIATPTVTPLHSEIVKAWLRQIKIAANEELRHIILIAHRLNEQDHVLAEVSRIALRLPYQSAPIAHLDPDSYGAYNTKHAFQKLSDLANNRKDFLSAIKEIEANQQTMRLKIKHERDQFCSSLASLCPVQIKQSSTSTSALLNNMIKEHGDVGLQASVWYLASQDLEDAITYLQVSSAIALKVQHLLNKQEILFKKHPHGFLSYGPSA